MDDTPNLKLPYILPAQAQKHVTHNEAIRALDAIVQIGVIDRNLTVPPVSPAGGDRYIVAAAATAAWSGKDGQVAAWQDGTWVFYVPLEGWLAWVADEDVLVAWDGSAWATAGGGGAGAFTALADTPADYTGAAGKMAVVNPGESAVEFADQVPLVGVNATADATNRLAVSSEASLFNHEGAGHQHKINKNAEGDTASILFQTGFSGRAEFGTTGDDDWHVKVSPDGSIWHEAIVVDKDTGRVGMGTSNPLDTLDVKTPGQGYVRFGGANGRTLSAFNAAGVPSNFDFNGSAYIAGGVIAPQIGDGLGFGHSVKLPTAGIEFWVSSTKRATIDSSGNLGVSGAVRVGSYTVATVPGAGAVGAGAIIHVSDETDGAVLAFSDGTSWRRVTDRAVIS